MAKTKSTTDIEETVDAPAPDPVEVEASGEDTMPIEYGGDEYIVPATVDDWSIDALEAAERGVPTQILRGVLGEDQYQLFKTRNNKVRAVREFSAKIAQASGFDKLGN